MQTTLLAAVLGLAIAGGFSEPRITGILPDKIATAPKAQQVTVNGQDFRGGLTLTVTKPGGEIVSLSGADISGQGATVFRVSFVFDAPGPYEFVVLNSDGGKSPPFRLDVAAATRAKPPWIDRVTPEEAARTQEPQVVTLNGGGFEAGLKLSVTDPTGTVTAKTAFDRLEPQIVVIRMAFEMAGTYSLMVTNPSGASSNAVTITIR